MANLFLDLLSERGVLLADGATGTNLFNMGLMSGDAPELWNTDEPAKITALYKGAVDAGSDLFLTNSFGANASRLKLHNAEKRVHELSRVAAELGRRGFRLLPVDGREHAMGFDLIRRQLGRQQSVDLGEVDADRI